MWSPLAVLLACRRPRKRSAGVFTRKGTPRRGPVLAAVLALAGGATLHAASLTLTGLSEFSTDASGGVLGSNLWNTLGGDGYFNLYVTSANSGLNGAFLNSGNGSAAGIGSVLGNGTYQFFIFGEPGADPGHFGLNLFFDGGMNPGISVFAATATSAMSPPPPFFADASADTRLLDGSGGAGAGTLTYSSGSASVTLIAYQWSAPNVNNLDRIAAFGSSPNGVNDFIGAFTLQVTGVPEPKGSLALACGTLALLGGGLLRRRLRRAAA